MDKDVRIGGATRSSSTEGIPDSENDRRGALRTASFAFLTIIALAIGYRDAIGNIIKQWESAEYSHGYLIPFIAIYIAIQRRRELQVTEISSTWIGLFFVLAGMAGSVIGDLSALYVITHYAFVLTILGLVVTMYGIRSVSILWPAFAYLLFMIPLPDFFYNDLSSRLQLVSSEIGIGVIRSFGISALLEGNVIDLGVYQLQVAEACSGLRYLFPLMSFGFLCAILYRGKTWVRIVLFISTVPIAVLMNSLRIGIVGVLVEFHGIAAAQGFLHAFEGWLVFLTCLLILFAVALILHRISGARGLFLNTIAPAVPVREIWPLRLPEGHPRKASVIASAFILILALASVLDIHRTEFIPNRLTFLSFPLVLDDWHGQEEKLSSDVLEALRLDDYLNVNFVSDSRGTVINLYVAYYASQRKGASTHSPKSCLPGGGWEIDRMSTVSLPKIPALTAKAMQVNRVVIRKGAARELVYYWFQQRGRVVANEYIVKWHILKDALMAGRTDGALIRLVTPLAPGEDPTGADAELARFIMSAEPALLPYIPN